MSKRSLPYRRNESELKGDARKGYRSMEKELGDINPVFLQKPYSACKSNYRNEVEEE